MARRRRNRIRAEAKGAQEVHVTYVQGGQTVTVAYATADGTATVVATLRDTLRLVRLMFDAPDAQRVEVAGDFNGWGASPTALVRDERSRKRSEPQHGDGTVRRRGEESFAPS